MRKLGFLVVGLCIALGVGAGAWMARHLSPNAASIFASYARKGAAATLLVHYPVDGTLFPPEIPAPTFVWQDTSGSNGWAIRLQFADGSAIMAMTTTPSWRPGDAQWEQAKTRAQAQDATVTIVGIRDRSQQPLSAAIFAFRVSTDPVGAPLFYREVILPFADAVKDPGKIRWRFGGVSSTEAPPVVLENLPVCGNCHSFSNDGKTLGMDVDYANDKGSYAIVPVQKQIDLDRKSLITWSDYKRDDHELTFGLLSQVSPDGRYVVSTVKDRSIFMTRDDRAFSQLFFPIKGIIGVYDRETKRFFALPGADDRRYVQSNPTWSPDGQYLIFARSEASDLKHLTHPESALVTEQEASEFFTERPQFRYDLYRIPFNGGKGGTPTPVPGASNNGMSNFFPRFSPDGKWLVFCRAKNFMLLQPDSELYIMPAAGGEARRMTCNTSRMNSWHSWSPNSRWLVFASKAESDYTQLWLTHIDDAGHDSPPVLLDRLTATDRAANIPEFINADLDAIATIRERFLDDLSFVRAGTDLFNGGNTSQAEQAFRKALSFNGDNAIAHFCLGNALATQGKMPEACVEFARAAELEPTRAEYQASLGKALRAQGRADEAVQALRRAVACDAKSADAQAELGKALVETETTTEGLAHLREAVRLAPHDFQHRYALAAALFAVGRRDEAISEATAARDQARAANRADSAAEIDAAIAKFQGQE